MGYPMSTLVSLEEFGYEVPEGWAERAYADASKYREMYAFSSSDAGWILGLSRQAN